MSLHCRIASSHGRHWDTAKQCPATKVPGAFDDDVNDYADIEMISADDAERIKALEILAEFLEHTSGICNVDFPNNRICDVAIADGICNSAFAEQIYSSL